MGQPEAAPADPALAAATAGLPRAVVKRLELWRRAAAGGLTARYTLTRRSSMLYDPLVVHGELSFTRPGGLVLRDDEAGGATTSLADGALRVAANDDTLPPGPAPGPASAAQRWLVAHLLALLAADDPAALLRDARAGVPRGPGMQLELGPPRSHPARTTLEHLRVRLDPSTGELLELEILETSGDRTTLALGGHRRAP